MAPARDILALIGNTPLLRLTRFDTGPCELFVKLENQNPGGSIKDRIALSMIDAAERDGSLKPGGTIVEATAGNTGLGLALVAARKGYPLILVVPDKMAREKIYHLNALGADVRLTRSDVGKGHPEYYQDMAQRLAGETGGWFVNQFANPANPLAHEQGTGPEIWTQMQGRVDAVVAGVGSGGTLTGLGRYFRRVSPPTEMVLADPAGSVLAPLIETGELRQAGSWAVEGIGEDFVPPNCDLSLVARAYTVADRDSFETARALLREEGLLAGSSAGTLVAAALRYCREQTAPRRVVTLIPDSGGKYLSKQYNDAWMVEQGFAERERHGDLRDLIVRRPDEGALVSIGPDDTLLTAYNRMRAADVSQLPVLEDGRVVGLVDESDLLINVRGRADGFAQPVRAAMTRALHTLPPTAPLDALLPIFQRGEVALVMEGERFLGLIARVDLLNHLRKEVP